MRLESTPNKNSQTRSPEYHTTLYAGTGDTAFSSIFSRHATIHAMKNDQQKPKYERQDHTEGARQKTLFQLSQLQGSDTSFRTPIVTRIHTSSELSAANQHGRDRAPSPLSKLPSLKLSAE